MKLQKRMLCAACVAAIFMLFCCSSAFAISESDLGAQAEAAGKEAVSGNVLIWFLCAIAFLKVSQKIDSFLSSLGVNVGNTGGSMLAEAMLAARGISAGVKNHASFSGGSHGTSGGSSLSGSGRSGNSIGSMFQGGLAGMVSRHFTNSAVQGVTNSSGSAGIDGHADTGSSGIGEKIYASSVSKGGTFANDVIGAVAQGAIGQTGSITGDKAVEALHSYFGDAALEDGAAHIPEYSNVEIGGGRITGTEVTETHPDGISFGMYHTAQYVAPDGAHETVHAVDGSAWYKQYAANAVEKSPYMDANGRIAYSESLIQKLPPPPRRKDRL